VTTGTTTTGTTTTVYTDGACIGNPGPGGWGWAVPDGPFASGAEAHTTNQRMEVTAALEAVRALPGRLEVVSDSRYVVDCFNNRWYAGWEAKGWKNSKKEPVANQDLWVPTVALWHERAGELTFRWVKGHANDKWNEVVDRLATEAAAAQVGRSGGQPPTSLGPADRPGQGTAVAPAPPAPPTTPALRPEPAAAAGPVAPPGHRVVIMGHRPPELGGYGESLFASDLRRRLAEILTGLAGVHPDLIVMTGLGLGAEQLGAEAAAAAGVAYVAVLAFPDPDGVWPAASRAAYRQLLDGATAVITTSATKPASKQAAGRSMGQRDDWLIAHADSALVVWDGKDRTLADRVRALERRIPDQTWVVSPAP